jgi:hypothetical protein
METYETFRPTGLDPAGLGLRSQQDWLVVPTGRNRDSDLLTLSNFDAALKMMGGEDDDCEVHRFGHWANGWFEIIIVKPDTKAATTAGEIEEALENYPVLDEDDWSLREYEAYVDNVENACRPMLPKDEPDNWLNEVLCYLDENELGEASRQNPEQCGLSDDDAREALSVLGYIDDDDS